MTGVQTCALPISSGRVLQKIGMRHEGTLREHTMKWGELLDDELYAMLAQDLRAGAY